MALLNGAAVFLFFPIPHLAHICQKNCLLRCDVLHLPVGNSLLSVKSGRPGLETLEELPLLVASQDVTLIRRGSHSGRFAEAWLSLEMESPGFQEIAVAPGNLPLKGTRSFSPVKGHKDVDWLMFASKTIQGVPPMDLGPMQVP